MKFRSSKTRLAEFSEIPVHSSVFEALDAMAITTPTAVQSEVIPVALAGSDLIAVAQTGSGKTLAFALPLLSMLQKNPAVRALIMAPSREMAQQIYKVFEQLGEHLGYSMALAIGGLPSAKQTTKLNRQPRILVATPGRLNDHLMTNKLLLQNVEIVVIDEADRMLDMGFAPQLKSIQATMRGPRQTLMFSASFDPAIETIAEVFMRDEIYMIRSEQAEAPVSSLKQRVLFLGKEQKHDRLLDEINSAQGGVIVFCGSQASCEDVADYLNSYGVSVGMIHGNLTQGNRNRVVREFREEKTRVIVATDLLARGLDVPHVEYVINFDLPFSAEDFLHRIGRTARAGRSGTAITFVTESDDRTYKKIKQYIENAEETVVTPGENLIQETRGPKRPARRERTDKYKATPKVGGKKPGGPRAVFSGKKAPKSFGRRK
jgi:superfamily II DNA/RNA helicase